MRASELVYSPAGTPVYHSITSRTEGSSIPIKTGWRLFSTPLVHGNDRLGLIFISNQRVDFTMVIASVHQEIFYFGFGIWTTLLHQFQSHTGIRTIGRCYLHSYGKPGLYIGANVKLVAEPLDGIAVGITLNTPISGFTILDNILAGNGLLIGFYLGSINCYWRKIQQVRFLCLLNQSRKQCL